ncbi:MAG: efflux RND transporter periplasmic adaptor subunit [Sphaerochaetaceae bacterium]
MGKGKRRMMVFLRFVVLLIALAVALYLVNRYVGKSRGVTYISSEPLVKIGKPQRRDLSRELSISSHVEARVMIPVVPLVSGTVMEYDAQVGELVKEGDVIAVIDDEPFRQQMLQAQAAYLAADKTYQRVKSLYDSKNTTVQNYDEATAQRDAAKAQYDLAALQVGYATVRAKTGGTIITAPSAKGSTAAQGTPLAVIADLGDLIVNLKVPEKEYDLFRSDPDSLMVTVVRPEGGAKVTAKVLNVDPYIQPQSKVFGLRCRLLGDVSAFRPGMYVKAIISYDRHENVPTLSQTVRKADGSCYLYDETDGTVHYLEMEPQIEDDHYFMVPLKYSDALFVIDGQNSVFDGQKVRVKEP